jgi:hypothetical protein
MEKLLTPEALIAIGGFVLFIVFVIAPNCRKIGKDIRRQESDK